MTYSIIYRIKKDEVVGSMEEIIGFPTEQSANEFFVKFNEKHGEIYELLKVKHFTDCNKKYDVPKLENY